MTPVPAKGATTRLGALRGALRSRVVGQTAIYSLSSGAAMLLGGVSRALLAGDLTPAEFGSFAFCTSFLSLAALFFDFGVFSPASRRLAQHADQRRELVGAVYLMFVPLGVAFGLFAFGSSYFVDDVFNVDAGEALRIASPLAFVWTFAFVGEQIAKGADRLHVFSLSNLVGRILFVGSLAVLFLLGHSFDVTLALVLNAAGLLLAVTMLVVGLRPRFAGARTHIATFVSDARDWGFQMWIGRVLSIGTFNMDVLMVAAFANAESTGFYALAAAICGLLGLPIVGYGAALFPRMARAERLDPGWLAASWAVGALGVLGIVLVAGPIVHLLFSDEYDPVIGLAVPLGIAQAVRGTTTIYNTFMSAHALGRELRNTALVLTGANVVFNFALIPPYGATGAAWASLAALVVNYVMHVVYYRRYMRRRSEKP